MVKGKEKRSGPNRLWILQPTTMPRHDCVLLNRRIIRTSSQEKGVYLTTQPLGRSGVFRRIWEKNGLARGTAWRDTFEDDRAVTDGVVTVRSSPFWGRKTGRKRSHLSVRKFKTRFRYILTKNALGLTGFRCSQPSVLPSQHRDLRGRDPIRTIS